jgi:hypothetical protein
MSEGPSLSGQYPVKFAKIEVAASGDTTIVPAVAGSRIRVIGYHLNSTDAKTLQWKSGSTTITGIMGFAANGSASASSDAGLFETAKGQALVLNAGAAGATGGALSYIEVS